ncbi:MAG: glycosyltransferase family 39 protein, partial [Planctomycetota bacterium]|nr:glycosyltransferase family 39 protein [Planctomycetota bacterium]
MKRVYMASLVVFALAFLVRLVCLVQVSSSPMFTVLMGDAMGYDAWAQQIAAGNWLGDSIFYQAPLYPYLLATIYTVVGHDLFAARMFQIVLGSCGCVFLAWTGRLLFRNPTGLIAGLLLALYPPAIFFDLIIQKGSLGLFFSTLLLLLLARASIRPNPGILAAVGATLGLFALTRENALILAAVILVWLLLNPSSEPYSMRRTRPKWFLLGLFAVLLPVGARNYKVGGQFLITTSQFGPNFYIGNNPDTQGLYESLRPGRGDPRFERLDATELAEADTGRSLSPKEVSDYWTDRALAYIRSDPAGWARLILRKWMLVWNAAEFADAEDIESYADASSALRTLGRVAHFGTLFPLAAFGIYATWNHRRRLWWLYAMAIAITAAIALFYVFARYRLPLIPILALFAAAALVYGRSLIKRRRTKGLLIGLACAAAVAIASNWTLVPGYEPRMATYTNIGAVLADNGRHLEAIDYYNRALAINPNLSE